MSQTHVPFTFLSFSLIIYSSQIESSIHPNPSRSELRNSIAVHPSCTFAPNKLFIYGRPELRPALTPPMAHEPGGVGKVASEAGRYIYFMRMRDIHL